MNQLMQKKKTQGRKDTNGITFKNLQKNMKRLENISRYTKDLLLKLMCSKKAKEKWRHTSELKRIWEKQIIINYF